MQQVAPEKIRNVALVGHGGSGKTTLAEALLHRAGDLVRVGRVEDATTVCDSDPQEQRRHQSVSLALAPFEWKGHKINLIDTPGYADFEGEVVAALRVVDLAVFVVSAVDGVEAQTERIWKVANRLGLPRMVFVNKLDRERASFTATLDQLREVFGAGIAPLELPIGEESGFRGVADLLSDTAFLYREGDGEGAAGEIPEDLSDLEHQVHDNLVEGIVVADDEQLERYLGGETLSVDELEHTLAVGVDRAEVFPVVCGSATAEIAVDRLADLICEIGPSPLDRPPVLIEAGPDIVDVRPDPAGEPLAFVFKTFADQYGAISLFKVMSGTVHADDHLINTRTGSDERLHSLFSLRGRTHLPVDGVPAGDIAAVAKLSATATGDTLAPRGRPVHVAPIDQPEPGYATAVVPRTQSDDDKLATALHRLLDEDPALVVDRSEETHQTIVRGLGETHVQIALERLEENFGVSVVAETVRVPYRETITASATAEGRHKKQSGGHGQFAVCTLQLEPLERGAGFEFVDRVVGGAIPRPFIPAVRKGIEETMAEGGVRGFPVVDVRVTCLDGRYHPVDSSELAFKMAARLAFRDAMAEAAPVVIEPISHIEVTVPIDVQGDVIGHLNTHRARVQGTSVGDVGEQVIEALVPTSELRRYAIDLRSLSRGRGTFHAVHDRYDVLPDQVGLAN